MDEPNQRPELFRKADAAHAVDLLKIIARTLAITPVGLERIKRLQAQRRNHLGKLLSEQAQEYMLLSSLCMDTETSRMDFLIEHVKLVNPETLGHTVRELLTTNYAEWGWTERKEADGK